MIKVYQTKFGIGGDCLRASLASYFEMKIIDVPSFECLPRESWKKELINWLFIKGYKLIEQNKHPSDDRYYLMLGRCPKGVLHCVVNQLGKTIHDPTPGNEIPLVMESVWLLEPLNRNR